MTAAGDALPSWTVTVDAERMKPMALLLRDPNPIHLDANVVANLGLGDAVINQGPLNATYLWEMLSRWSGDPARVRRLRVRFTSNAYAGTRLVAGGEVLSVQDRMATCNVWLRDDRDRDVLRGTAEVLLMNEEKA